MRKLLLVPCILLAFVLTASPAHATLILFGADLLGSNESPPTNSNGTGSILVTLDDVTDMVTVDESFSGLTIGTTAAHLHCCAPIGVNAGVVLPFSPSFGFPLGVTSGTYHHVFNLNTDLSGITTAAFIAGLEGGMVYANIHTSNFPGGEIRGQLAPVPEPASIVLLGTGLLGVARSFLRRRGVK